MAALLVLIEKCTCALIKCKINDVNLVWNVHRTSIETSQRERERESEFTSKKQQQPILHLSLTKNRESLIKIY